MDDRFWIGEFGGAIGQRSVSHHSQYVLNRVFHELPAQSQSILPTIDTKLVDPRPPDFSSPERDLHEIVPNQGTFEVG